MPARVRDAALYVIRALGGFAIAQYFTRRRLRILCYHGFSLGDEHEYIPHMFMRADTFRRRLEILGRRRIPVVKLDEAVTAFKRGAILNSETVITLDDGWASNLYVGAPLLSQFGFPACIYVTTNHLTSPPEVFNVVLYYLILKSGLPQFRLSGIHPAIDGEFSVGNDPTIATTKIIEAAERHLDSATRHAILTPIATALGLTIADVLTNGRFQLLSRDQIARLSNGGIDIELHTHTHRLPSDLERAKREVELNRDAVISITGRDPKHFCYPSGLYGDAHPKLLADLGILSATTCDPGLNEAGTSAMLLRRFLDSETESDIAFEAEISGLRELARAARKILQKSVPLKRRHKEA
jgi:peptidoglycan/xylan/chitin deacetylase (PgdA/CDA1 family)